MARILIEGNHEELAKKIKQALDLSDSELQLTHSARLSLAEARPRILLFDYLGFDSTQKSFLSSLRSEKIPFIALIAKGRYCKNEQGKTLLLVREAMECGARGVFYTDCHENAYCLEEMVRLIKEAITKF